MKPNYETVVDTWELLPLAFAMGIHALIIALQIGLATFLVISGALALRPSIVPPAWQRSLGLSVEGAQSSRGAALLRIGLGVLLLLPLLVGAPTLVSLLAGLGAFAVLLIGERAIPAESRRRGRLARGAALLAAAVVALFIVWEGEDGLALGIALSTNMQEWRVRELEWQHENDVEAPKVGDLAPDFELHDPNGETAVRLSDYRDQRPVVLVFGSYT